MLTIAQFGIVHFALVLEDGAEQQVPFKPLVSVKGNLTELHSLSHEIQQLFEEYHARTQKLFQLIEEQKSKEKRYTELLEQKEEIKSSSAYNSDEKGKFLTMLDKEINDLVNSFLPSKIIDIENQVTTLQHLIDERIS
jgi:vacuolar-type H+-ATPase subunit I/STV1